MSFDRMTRRNEIAHSPCVGHCTYGDDNLCLSCRRHYDEVQSWKETGGEELEAIWARIPSAIDANKGEVMRLPLAPEDIVTLAVETLTSGGSWAVGVDGAWVYAQHLININNGLLKAKGDDGKTTITLDLRDRMRALAWRQHQQSFASDLDKMPLLLVVPEARIKQVPATEPTPITEGNFSGGTDLGLGLPSIAAISHGKDLIFKTMLAEAHVKDASHSLPQKGVSPIPSKLNMPSIFVLGAVLLPKGMRLD